MILNELEIQPKLKLKISRIIRHKNFTHDWILKYPDLSWDYSYLSYRHDITDEILDKYRDIKWNFILLSKNRSFQKILVRYSS